MPFREWRELGGARVEYPKLTEGIVSSERHPDAANEPRNGERVNRLVSPRANAREMFVRSE